MGDIDVQPDLIHQAAMDVEGAGHKWDGSVGKLSSDMGSIGDPYGGDELGGALKTMYDNVGPEALKYFDETGVAIVETAIALDKIAVEYTKVEEHNTDQVRKVDAIVESLEEP